MQKNIKMLLARGGIASLLLFVSTVLMAGEATLSQEAALAADTAKLQAAQKAGLAQVDYKLVGFRAQRGALLDRRGHFLNAMNRSNAV